MLVCSRNESDTRRPSNSLMMSRFCSTRDRVRTGPYGRCRSVCVVYHDELRERRLARRGGAEEARAARRPPPAPASAAAATACAAGGGRKSSRSQQRMPSTLPSAWGNRFAKNAARSPVVAVAVVPVDVGVEILDEDLAPELLAEERDVGPDDGAKVEQHGIGAAGERRQELPERLGGILRARTARARRSATAGRFRVAGACRPAGRATLPRRFPVDSRSPPGSTRVR